MKCANKLMQLYAVTDRSFLGKKTLYSQIEEAVKGGVTCVQLREKQLSDEDFLKEALEIKELCKKYGVPLFINDNVKVALLCKADGVHVGQDDMPVSKVRKMVGDEMIIGVSAQTVSQAIKAQNDGADCLGVGAVFSTSTKLDADSVSYDELKRICEAVSIPVVAIGGINKDNIMKLSASGADGVALVSAIFAAKDIEGECKKLKAMAQRLLCSNIKGVIFDLDGTLLDSMYIWDSIGADYLKSRGIEPDDGLDDILKAMSLPEGAKYLKSNYDLNCDEKTIADDINHMIQDIYQSKARLKPKVYDFLCLLKEKNIKMCVATATDRHLAKASLKLNGIESFFDGILTCTEVGYGKTSPVIYEKAMELLGTDKKSTLIFEDAVHAIETAKKSDFLVAGVWDSFEKNQGNIQKLSDLYINDFSFAIRLFKGDE